MSYRRSRIFSSFSDRIYLDAISILITTQFFHCSPVPLVQRAEITARFYSTEGGLLPGYFVPLRIRNCQLCETSVVS